MRVNESGGASKGKGVGDVLHGARAGRGASGMQGM